MKSPLPVRQTGMVKTRLYVFPDPKVGRPTRSPARLCFSDFFSMFRTPFKYGAAWDRKADEGPEQVVVLSEEMNDTLFGGADSVGRMVRIESREFKVVGVLEHWRPTVKFYDVTQNFVEAPEALFLPFNLLRPMQLRTAGNSDGWRSAPAPGFEGLLASDQCWIQMWVELPDRQRVAAYQEFLNAYALEQKKSGRFQRPLNNRVTPMMGWLREMRVVPAEITAMMIVSLLFLAVCALNLMGLLLGKFLARAPEVGVRRALGARRIDIFVQHVVECELVGVLGGGLGMGLSLLGLLWMNTWMRMMIAQSGRVESGSFFRLDLEMALLALVLSLAAGLVAGLYPAWRICRTAPATHLKVQ
jgi:putative ABC transport system permease protein